MCILAGMAVLGFRLDLVSSGLAQVLFDAGVLGALCRPIWAGFLSSY